MVVGEAGVEVDEEDALAAAGPDQREVRREDALAGPALAARDAHDAGRARRRRAARALDRGAPFVEEPRRRQEARAVRGSRVALRIGRALETGAVQEFRVVQRVRHGPRHVHRSGRRARRGGGRRARVDAIDRVGAGRARRGAAALRRIHAPVGGPVAARRGAAHALASRLALGVLRRGAPLEEARHAVLVVPGVADLAVAGGGLAGRDVDARAGRGARGARVGAAVLLLPPPETAQARELEAIQHGSAAIMEGRAAGSTQTTGPDPPAARDSALDKSDRAISGDVRDAALTRSARPRRCGGV